ncbi:hypothetical protein [Shinella sp.]|uniref:hypothetical protein n=1 Tax=Shinella sp. TaxID=1870904 RepID=UPI0039E3C9F0
MKRKTNRRLAVAALAVPVGYFLFLEMLLLIGLSTVGEGSLREVVHHIENLLKLSVNLLFLAEFLLAPFLFLFAFNYLWVSFRSIAPLEYEQVVANFPLLFWDELVAEQKAKREAVPLRPST